MDRIWPRTFLGDFMYVIRMTNPTYKCFEFLSEERGYSGPVYGYDMITAILYETKSSAQFTINNTCKEHRRHRSISEGGYGLEVWSIVKVSDKQANEIKKFKQRQIEFQWHCRVSEAESTLKGTPYKVVRKTEND
jgi:hypothetical protein